MNFVSVEPLAASKENKGRGGLFVALLIAAAVIATILAFSDALLELVKRWTAEEEYSHGFLIPLVSAWLLWARRDALLGNLGRPSWSGPILILLAVLIHVIGEYTSIFILSQLSFIVVLMGLVLAVGGFSLLKTAFVPIAFLIFAVPVPYFIEANLTLQLQLISSQLGVEVIRLFHIPVYLEGNVIDLGYYKLQVVEACSGLRYLYPLLSLSFLAAYMFQAPMWQRVLVFVSGIPITIGMNGFRIGMVGITVDRWGPKMADEALHLFEGWIIFLACAALLLAEIFILAKVSGRKFFQVFHLPAPTAQPSYRSVPIKGGHSVLVSSFVIVCGAGLLVHSIAHRTEITPERTRFAAFPTSIGDWQGHSSLLDPWSEKALRLDDYLLSDYADPSGKAVNLYIAYYTSQRNGYSPHSPVVCLPGDGWLITSLERTTYDGAGQVVPINRVVMDKGGSKQLVYYWFDERGRNVASEYWAKWYLLADAITKNRTDGALIRLITPIFPGESQANADQRLQSFMKAVVPLLPTYLPSEQQSSGHSADASGNNEHG